MKPVFAIGGILVLVGLAMIVAPMVLPRATFGELGHGDGFGLMGLMLYGAMIGGVGLLTLLGGAIAAAINDNRKIKRD